MTSKNAKKAARKAAKKPAKASRDVLVPADLTARLDEWLAYQVSLGVKFSHEGCPVATRADVATLLLSRALDFVGAGRKQEKDDFATAARLLRETASALPCCLDADGFDVTEVDHATLIRIYGIGGEAHQLDSRYPQRPAKKGGK